MSYPALHLCRAFESACEQVVLPWLRDAAQNGWRSDRERVLLVPSRAYASAIRQRLHRETLHIAGLRIWTPGSARDALASAMNLSGSAAAIRENLHLLIALTAAQSGSTPFMSSITRDASRLMRTLDALAAGGHNVEAASANLSGEIPPLAIRFAARLHDLSWLTVQQLDSQLLAAAARESSQNSDGEKLFASVLAVGFDGLHWELWPLLRAITHCSVESTLVFNQPRYKAEQIDQLWIGTWEREFGESTLLPETESPQPYAPLAAQMENPGAEISASIPPAHVLIGRNLREQSDAIAACAAHWLATGNVTRLGILVPGPGPLTREISRRLLDRGILHFDSLGHTSTPGSEAQQWTAWLALQREQKLGPLLTFLNHHDPDTARFPNLRVSLETAYTELLTDDLAALAAWLAVAEKTSHRAAALALASLALLPRQATLREFLEATRIAAAPLAWPALQTVLDQQALAITGLLDDRPTRSLYLDWLTAVTVDIPVQRDPRTTNPAAPVHVLTYSDAESLPWSHLLMTGMNEGHWPPTFDPPGFLREYDIAELNRSVTETGNQGEGHLVIKEGHTLILGPAEQRALARRQFYNLVETPTHELALTAALEDDETSRALGPGDFLSHLYFTQTNEPLTAQRLTQIHSATQSWIATAENLAPPPATADVTQTQIAHTARRTNEPFGEYEFALREPPATPVSLACKNWEAAIKSPAATWLAEILGVAAERDILDGNPWPLTTGTWVHAWLSTAIAARHPEKLVLLPDPAELPARVRAAAHRTRDRVTRAYAAAGRPLPDRWQSGWARAAWIATEIAARIGTIADWPFAATEWTLPKPTEIKLREKTLRVRGRMDLVLSREELFSSDSNLWLFDFKTGSDKPLKPADLLKKFTEGKSKGGIQLALYALALKTLGAKNVDVTLLTPDALVALQITLADIETLADFWRGLAHMQDTAIFGMRGELRSDYTHIQTLPLATLEIPPDLLEKKWAITHPLLSNSEEPQKAQKAQKESAT